MKSNINTKILKLAVVEILAQSGFDKTAEQALNVLTDILKYYIEQLVSRIKRNHESGVVPELVYRIVIRELYAECEYQIPELLSFLRYQINIKNYLSDRYNVGCEESILHILRVLPKNVQLKTLVRNNRNLNDASEMKEEFVDEDVTFDDFTRDFVESSLSEQSRRVVGEYKFQFMEFIDKKPREPLRINKNEFNEILEMKKSTFEFFREPETIIDDFSLWNNRYVFKDYEPQK